MCALQSAFYAIEFRLYLIRAFYLINEAEKYFGTESRISDYTRTNFN